MIDDTEDLRRQMLASGQPARDLAQAQADAAFFPHKQWTTDELREEFEVIGFMAPFVVVRRKADGVKGSMMFTHSPRVYFDFKPD